MKLTALMATVLLTSFAEPIAEEAPEAASGETAAPASIGEQPVGGSASSEPSTFAQWWNGEESIYEGRLNLSLGFFSGTYNGGNLKTEGVVDSVGIEKGRVSGIRGDMGVMGRHFGFLVAGGAYYFAGDETALVFSDGGAPVSLHGADLRLFHPRLRFALWRFELAASVGPVAHLGWFKLDEGRRFGGAIPARFRTAADSNFYASVAAELGAGLRFYPLDFLFVEGAYNHSFALFNIVGEMDGMNSFRLGAGLSF